MCIKIITIILSFVCIFFPQILLADNEIQSPEKLMIFICNKQYEGEKFIDNGLLYVALPELAPFMKIGGEVKTENEKTVIQINKGVEKTIEFKYKILFKNNKCYIPLTSFCQKLGYVISYDKTTNILDIGTSKVLTTTELSCNNSNIISNENDSYLITPGKNIGAVFLGYSIDKVINILGYADIYEIYNPRNGIVKKLKQLDKSIDLSNKKVTLIYTSYSLEVEFDGDTKQATFIRVWDSKYETKTGLKLGSTINDVYKVYPGAVLLGGSSLHTYQGISFAIDLSKMTVKKIIVLRD